MAALFMAITCFIQDERSRPDPITDKGSLLRTFETQQNITVASGVTCAFLGDERNLREYLVAAEAVQALKDAGHIVNFLLFDDSRDPLSARQLRVAVNKDPVLIEKYQHYCGVPISDIPSPAPGSSSWANHFQKALLRRLAHYDCTPNLLSTSNLYDGGVYQAFTKLVLNDSNEILRYLRSTFPGYTPQALYYPICPLCGRISNTHLVKFADGEAVVGCDACGLKTAMSTSDLRGKLAWKLDCAARWRIFGVDVEPFSKAYLEPNAGSFWIARAIADRFFGGANARPMLFGMVKVDPSLNPASLGSLPPATLRKMYVERWSTDLHLTRERLLLAASKADHPGGTSYVDAIRRNLPTLEARVSDVSTSDFAFVRSAEVFQETVLGLEAERTHASARLLEELDDVTLWGLSVLIRDAIAARRSTTGYDAFDAVVKQTSADLGEARQLVHVALRESLNHRKGLPVRRLLYTVPIQYLDLLYYAVEKTIQVRDKPKAAPTYGFQAVVQMETEMEAPVGI